jgi:hypothetical protein
LPIGTSDAGSLMSASLAAGIDYFHANGALLLLLLSSEVAVASCLAWTDHMRFVCFRLVHPYVSLCRMQLTNTQGKGS